MDIKTLTEIDYFRIREQVADYCVSAEGRGLLLERLPSTKTEEIENWKNLSREWSLCHHTSKGGVLKGWEACGPLIPIIKTNGAALTLEQLKALGQLVLSVQGIKKYLSVHGDELELKCLTQEAEKIPDFTETENKIFRVITTDGELRDLPEITAIRKQIASLHSKIKAIMQGFISDQKYASILESTVPVLRGEHQVLAVKASLQNRIPGIVYEVSQTGQTVYVEPQEAVLCSNELVQKEYELQAVIKRILAELTASLQPSIPAFNAALPVMYLFDQTQAAARWGAENNCVYAVTVDAEREAPVLVQARHPLLGEKAVPIDIRFMEGKRVLIITGPNTGGKTVSLKTFALLSMLNQSGFPIPASEGTRLPVFDSIFADIGDDQSLDQSLSTFSGHMKNIAHAVEGAGSNSLILLDELGSGTDPQEGTAISMAVLDELIKRRSFVLVTTHQGILKNYGYTNPSCINASVEFNQDTLSPSYHLLMGVPGESHALDIAQRNGLPLEICKAARHYIASEQADVSALIRGLNRKHLELNKVQKEASRREREFTEKYERLKSRELELRRRENELKKERTQELDDFLIHTRRKLENMVRTLKEGEITREKTLGVKQFINELTSDTQRLEAKVEKEEENLAEDQKRFDAELKKKGSRVSNKKTKKKLSNAEALKTATVNEALLAAGAAASGGVGSAGSGRGGLAGAGGRGSLGARGADFELPLRFEPGAVVTAGATGTEGILLEQTRKGVWQVQFGSVKMTVKEKDLTLSKKQTLTATYTDSSVDYASYSAESAGERPAFELRLLGMRAEEAEKALSHQIDLCILNNFLHFSVIHGKGDGILMQMVKDYLSHCTSVASFEQAPAEDGGAGKTYVTLKG